MKAIIDAIFLEVTGRDISQESQLEFHPHPSGTGHTFIYREYRKAPEGVAFDTPEEFRAKISPAPKAKPAAKKSVAKKVAEKVKETVKKAVKKVTKKK